MVFYRKYRPQTISELDLQSVRDRLTAILSSGDVPHAFLFDGPKGLGKTSSARILAKAINCEKRNQELSIKNHVNGTSGSQDLKSRSKEKEEKKLTANSSSLNVSIEPCNECSACISITNGSNLDVIEIDAASNRGIDQIRDLREKIKFAPTALPYKVYIIDEVHMLTTEAFNALLKTLEEPPKHAVFILCTTEQWRLPDTIVSRAFEVRFEKPTLDDIVHSLEKIVHGEKFSVEPDVLRRIAKLSGGSFRDAHKLMEELSLSANGKPMTLSLFESVFQFETLDQDVLRLFGFLSERKTKDALEVVESLVKKGADFSLVLEKMAEFLRMLLLKQSGLSLSDELEFDSFDAVSRFSRQDIEILSKAVIDAYKTISYSPVPSLPLELLVIQWGMEEKAKDMNNESGIISKTSIPGGLSLKNQPKVSEKLDEEPRRDQTPPNPTDHSNKSTIGDQGFLKQLIEKVNTENRSVAAVLRGCTLVSEDDGKVVLETRFKFHLEKLQDTSAKKIIEKHAEEILGKKTSIEIRMKS